MNLEARSFDPSVTLITVTYNSATTLDHCWKHFDPAWAEWIVVDNASSDSSFRTAATHGADPIRLGSNVGFSAANNVAGRSAEGEVLIFCNPDVIVDQSGIRELARLALAEPRIVAPQLVNPDGSLQENGRGAPYPHRKLKHMFGRHDPNSRYHRYADAGELRQVVWVMGAAIAMSRETFDRIGGWNPAYFIYYEDAEICLRALRSGVPTFVTGDVRWVHQWARDTKRSRSWTAWKHEIRSGLRFYLTNPSTVIPIGRAGRMLRMIDRDHTPCRAGAA